MNVYRNPGRERRVSMPIESHPSALGARNPFAEHPFVSRDPYQGGDRYQDAIRCGQCGAGQMLSEASTCYNCGSDNRLNVRL